MWEMNKLYPLTHMLSLLLTLDTMFVLSSHVYVDILAFTSCSYVCALNKEMDKS